MTTLLIKNVAVIGKDKIMPNQAIYCKDGIIDKIVPESRVNGFGVDEIVDARGMYASPGYIDLHIHGCKNILADDGRESIEKLSEVLTRFGVTSYLPTVIPKQSFEEDVKFIKDISSCGQTGARILGFFLEGHFLSLTGALPNVYKNKNKKMVQILIEEARPYKLVFGVSPEAENIEHLIPEMIKSGYPAFVTHTAADAAQTKAAISLGANHATHFYDVFPVPSVKEPGVRPVSAVEAFLSDDSTTVDFILDGEHVDPLAVKMALKCLGKDRVCLVTDANVNAGMPPGTYKGVSGSDIIVQYEGGPARRAKSAEGKSVGGLIGSGLTMDLAVKNAIKMLGLDIPSAVAMASYNPAKVLGLGDSIGALIEGHSADIILMDEHLNVQKTWVKGKRYF